MNGFAKSIYSPKLCGRGYPSKVQGILVILIVLKKDRELGVGILFSILHYYDILKAYHWFCG